MKQLYRGIFVATLLALGSTVAVAADQDRDRDQLQERDQYGWQLMTPQERIEHREKIRSMKTEQEREAYRQQHHEKMQQRAKEKGVTLPDKPQPRGQGMGNGPGNGMGGGAGRR